MTNEYAWGPPPGAAAPDSPPPDDYFSLGPPLPPLPPEGEVAGSPAPGPVPNGAGSKRRRAIRPVAIGALVVGVLTIVGVSVSAAQGSSSPSASPNGSSTTATTMPSSGYPKGGMRGRFGFGPFGRSGGLGGAIHGEFVRPNGSGYQTVDVQVGQVTAVSSSSITVKSSDGFTKTYSVDTNTLVNAGRDGIGSVKVNDTVSVQAVVNGKTAAAANILDRTTLGALRQHWRPVPPLTSSTTTP